MGIVVDGTNGEYRGGKLLVVVVFNSFKVTALYNIFDIA
jgi:hypothetical protein